MPREAKLGLVIGVALVIVVAVMLFRKEAAEAGATTHQPTIAARPPGALPVSRGGKKHLVKEGDTLFSLAQQYYNDSGRFVDLYQANRRVLKTPEHLPAGTVLVIPDP